MLVLVLIYFAFQFTIRLSLSFTGHIPVVCFSFIRRIMSYLFTSVYSPLSLSSFILVFSILDIFSFSLLITRTLIFHHTFFSSNPGNNVPLMTIYLSSLLIDFVVCCLSLSHYICFSSLSLFIFVLFLSSM